LAVALVTCTLWLIISGFAAGRRRWLSFGLAAVWLLVATSWFVVVGVGVLIVARRGLDWARTRRDVSPISEPLTEWTGRIAHTLGVFLCIAAAVGVVRGGVLAAPGEIRTLDLRPHSAPNIYVLLLDGYPRADTTLVELGFSNEPFLDDLESRGFDVSRLAKSNYNTTLLTLTSMLHMEYVNAISALRDGEMDEPLVQVRKLTAALNGSPVVESLRSIGYRIVTIPSWYGEATLRTADVIREAPTLTIFEEQLLRLGTIGQTIITAYPEVVAAQQRQRVEFTFASLAEAASEEDHPRLVFAHLFSPHPPILFRADGSPHPPPPCYPRHCSFNLTDARASGLPLGEFRTAFAGELTYLNARLLTVIDELTTTDPHGIVLLFSDHGMRHNSTPNAEHYRILLAARTPGRTHVLPDDVSLVNVFAQIFNAYFDTAVPILDYRAWSADSSAPLELTPVQ
jgi:hypothetical protein